MRPFERAAGDDDGPYVAQIDGPFVGALARLCDQVARLLAERGAAHGPGDPVVATTEAGRTDLDPDDPLARLNPPSSRVDPARSAEFRRLTLSDLDQARIERLSWLAGKLRGAKVSLLRPARVAIEPDDVPRALMAINDLRLVLAQRLAIDDAEAAESIYERAMSAGPGSIDALLYVVTSALQDSLLEAMG